MVCKQGMGRIRRIRKSVVSDVKQRVGLMDPKVRNGGILLVTIRQNEPEQNLPSHIPFGSVHLRFLYALPSHCLNMIDKR